MEFYTVEQVAEKLSVKIVTIQEWLRTGKLRGYKIGKGYRITSNDIEEMLQGTRTNSSNRPGDFQRVFEPKDESTKKIIKKALIEQLTLIEKTSKREEMKEMLPELTNQMVNISTFLMQYCE